MRAHMNSTGSEGRQIDRIVGKHQRNVAGRKRRSHEFLNDANAVLQEIHGGRHSVVQPYDGQ